jgi:glycine cleavage system pyridoxal-binding protein P
MRYESLSDDDRRFMLGVLGLESIDDLFEIVPAMIAELQK